MHPKGYKWTAESIAKMKQSVQSNHDRKKTAALEQWKTGNLVLSARRAKTLLVFEGGERCVCCGWGERNPCSNTVPIEIEHVDGDCYNNAYENVKLLCPNCHSLTPTFRALNAGRGKGRKAYKVVSVWAKEQGIKGIYSSKRD